MFRKTYYQTNVFKYKNTDLYNDEQTDVINVNELVNRTNLNIWRLTARAKYGTSVTATVTHESYMMSVSAQVCLAKASGPRRTSQRRLTLTKTGIFVSEQNLFDLHT